MLVKQSFSLSGHRTSVALEPEFWAALRTIAAARGQSLSALVATTDAARAPDRPLASALRVLALEAAAGGGVIAAGVSADGTVPPPPNPA